MFIANDIALDRSSIGAKCNSLEQHTKARNGKLSSLHISLLRSCVLIDTPIYKHYVPPGLQARKEERI